MFLVLEVQVGEVVHFFPTDFILYQQATPGAYYLLIWDIINIIPPGPTTGIISSVLCLGAFSNSIKQGASYLGEFYYFFTSSFKQVFWCTCDSSGAVSIHSTETFKQHWYIITLIANLCEVFLYSTSGL